MLCTCEAHYHAVWSSLRAAEITNSLKTEEPLLRSLITPFIRDDARVMIGGSADPGVLCVIGRIYAPSWPAVTIVDRCPAPLEVIRTFTAAKGIACRTLLLNLLDLDGSEQWDQIVLHYTPDFVDTYLHDRFFRALARSLAPGGKLVFAAMTGARIAGDDSRELASVYFDYCLKALAESPLADLASTPEFVKMLRDYADAWGRRRGRLPTAEELRAPLIAAGLKILSESTLPRRKRFVGNAAIVDANSFFVAGH